MLAEPPRTRYDIYFKLFGFSVRVSPFFWLAGAVLALYFVQGMKGAPARDKIGVFLIFVACMFVSILVHELGHALLIRRYGWGSRIILYHFGGLATFESPERYLPMHNENEERPWVKILIAFAGPAAGFLLAGLVIGILFAADVGLAFKFDSLRFWHFTSDKLPYRAQQVADVLLQLNIFWGLLNLLPIYPLDGGQIARELFTLKNPRKGVEFSLLLSAITGVVVAGGTLIWKGLEGLPFAIMFGVLAFGSYRTYQLYKQQFGMYGGQDEQDDADWWKR